MSDLSRLPAPQFVETVDFETLVTAIKADVALRVPEIIAVLDLESEPVVKLIECFAYRETLLRVRINEAAKATLLAYATGDDLENLGALLNTDRLEGESDKDFRHRISEAFERLSNAGPAASYAAYARAADPRVRDVAVSSPNPGEVLVTILTTAGDGISTPDLLSAVEAQLSRDDVRPLTDEVTVVGAIPVYVDIDVTLKLLPGVLAGPTTDAVETALSQYFADDVRIGEDVALSGIAAACHQSGVRQALVTLPAGNVAVAAGEAGVLRNLTITPVLA